jgi:hypothetical protein
VGVGFGAIIVGLWTLWVIHRQTTAIEQQAGIMERQTVLAYRPKIVIRNIVIHGLEKLDRQTPMNQWSTDLTGFYTVANVGGTPTTVRRIIDGAWVEKGLPMERPDRSNVGRTVNIPLAPGESIEIDFGHIALTGEDACDLIEGKSIAYFLGRIEYIDSSKIVRETSACRTFDPKVKHFIRVDNPDYEYSD